MASGSPLPGVVRITAFKLAYRRYAPLVWETCSGDVSTWPPPGAGTRERTSPMTWTSFHRRGDVLREVIAAADQRRDGLLPSDVDGVSETFTDELDLLAALQ